MEMTVQETAKNLLAAEIAHGCTERRTGVKSGSMDRVLQHMAILL